MAKKLLIRTPQTTNGIDLAYDEDRQPIFKETLVPIEGKKMFESLNNSMPEQLRAEFKTVEVDENDRIVTAKAAAHEAEETETKTRKNAATK